MKYTSFVICSLISFSIYSQSVSSVGRVNLSIGTSYHEMDYSGGTVFYSPGGGIGLEGGLSIPIINNLTADITLSYQLHLALQSENANGASNTTRFNFNRKSINLGIHKTFPLNKKAVPGILIGAGTSYHLPGTLARVENDNDLGNIEYDPNGGAFVQLGVQVRFKKGYFIIPNLRYRMLSFSSTSFEKGSLDELPRHLQQLDADGFELGISISK